MRSVARIAGLTVDQPGEKLGIYVVRPPKLNLSTIQKGGTAMPGVERGHSIFKAPALIEGYENFIRHETQLHIIDNFGRLAAAQYPIH